MSKNKLFNEKYWYLLTIIIFIELAIYWYLKSEFNFFEDLNSNIFTEFLGILFTIIIIDRLNIIRGNQQEKTRLISQMASPANSIAIDAIRILRLNNWLTDGTIQNNNFSYGDYSKADLSYASVIGSNFSYAILDKANLCQANFSRVLFHETILENSKCNCSIFTGAEIRSSNFRKYNFNNVDLYQAVLSEATFIVSINGEITTNPDDVLRYAKRLNLAIMPDEKKYNGKYNLQGDLATASAQNINIHEPKEMAKFYEVSIEEYNQGQIWFKESGIDRSLIATI